MDPLLALLVLAALVGVTLIAGLLWRRSQGAARTVAPDGALDPALFGASGAVPHFGARATLVQFSTTFCSGCPATRRVLNELSAASEGVAYVDVDVTDRADLVRRFSILQTPTTLILDRHGVVRTRIGGTVRRASVVQELEQLP